MLSYPIKIKELASFFQHRGKKLFPQPSLFCVNESPFLSFEMDDVFFINQVCVFIYCILQFMSNIMNFFLRDI